MLPYSTCLLSLYFAAYGTLAAPTQPPGRRSQKPLDDVARLLVDIRLESAVVCGDEISAPISAIDLSRPVGANTQDLRSGIIRVQVDPETLKVAKTDELCNGALAKGIPEHGNALADTESLVIVFKKTPSGLWGLKCDRPIVKDNADREKKSSAEADGDDVESIIKKKNGQRNIAVSEFDIEIL
ncbi:hypothetical protein ABW21_db0201554 [Orbilia brochopaga]|nr:hypothetical protein ABW21_db0201554 [Drechslerella brochopaga]